MARQGFFEKKLTTRKGIKISTLFLMVFLFLPQIANSADWNMYGMNKGEAYLYDKHTLKYTGEMVRVWTRLVLSEKSIGDLKNLLGQKYNGVTYSNYLEEVQCTDKKIRVLSIVFYNKENDVLGSVNYDDSNWVVIPPESVFDRLHNKVCN
jgi:hypothetical protein